MSEQTHAHSDAIDPANGRKRWEGEHAITIRGRAPTWDSKIEIDGKPIERDTQRIEIDIDCEKAQAVVVLTRFAKDEAGHLLTADKTLVREKHELLANLLDLTADECLVVDKILDQARKEASSNSLATQLFAINESEEDGQVTTYILSQLITDAKRYRAMRENSIREGYLDLSDECDSAERFDEFADKERQTVHELKLAQRAKQS